MLTSIENGSEWSVFLSHSAADREFVSQLASDLERAGIRVWLDQWDIRPGQSFAEAIDRAIKAARFVLIVMSPDYFESSWTRQEWQYGLSREIENGSITLIPLLYRDCEIPPLLRTKQWVDFRDGHDYQVVLGGLIQDLYALLKNESAPADFPRPGERLEELDAVTVSQLKNALTEAVELFRYKPGELERTSHLATEIEDDLCFVIMPFSIESLNIVYEDFVRPVLIGRCHLRCERGDDVFGSNVIMDDIAKSIRKSRLIVADLTGRNPNVFYEVGIAHALGKEVLLMTQSVDDVPFDLRYRRALVYEYSPRGCKRLEKDLFDNVQKMLAMNSQS